MMDELELLKKDWQKRDDQHPKLSYDEIHNMLWKKSSSIVKWILIISILEIILPNLLYLLPSMRDGLSIYENTAFNRYYLRVSIFYYAVLAYFIYLFYKRYREISVLDDAKSLMRKIIKTRRTVKYYVVFSLSMILVTVMMVLLGIYQNNDFMPLMEEMAQNGKDDIAPERLKMSLMVAVGILGVLMTLVIGAVYFLLYGLLLRKLKKNYHELKRLEV